MILRRSNSQGEFLCRCLTMLIVVLFALPAAARTVDAATLDLQREQRVARVGYQLARAGLPHCNRAEAMTGMGLHDLSSYPERHRATIGKLYHMVSGFGVRFVVAGSAADRAGLRANDEIIGLNGQSTNIIIADPTTPKASSARTDAFEGAIRAALRQGPAALELRRDDRRFVVQLPVDIGCGGRFVVAEGNALDAWSDGLGVAITGRMVDFAADDDELAFVLAHELAHNILGHAERTRGRSRLLASVGFGAGPIKAAEIEADKFAIGLMRRAGHNVVASETLLHRLARARGPSFAFTHPGTKRRIEIIRAAAVAAE